MQQFDMVAAIRTWKTKSPIIWTSKHILGHQDENPWNVLDRHAFYNCEMDKLAKERWERLQREGPALQHKIDGEPWPLYIAGKKISHNFLTAIHEEQGDTGTIINNGLGKGPLKTSNFWQRRTR
jgi:hypothetical protein